MEDSEKWNGKKLLRCGGRLPGLPGLSLPPSSSMPYEQVPQTLGVVDGACRKTSWAAFCELHRLGLDSGCSILQRKAESGTLIDMQRYSLAPLPPPGRPAALQTNTGHTSKLRLYLSRRPTAGEEEREADVGAEAGAARLCNPSSPTLVGTYKVHTSQVARNIQDETHQDS